MRNKDLEHKRDDFIRNYYKMRVLRDKNISKKEVSIELNMFFTFYSRSNIYRILHDNSNNGTKKKNNNK